MPKIKTYEEINRKLNSGEAVILTAEEVTKMAKEASPEEILEKVDVEYLKKQNIICESLDKRIHFQEVKCIDCGNCTAVCFPGALTMNKETWKLEFDKNQCVVCELCIPACPLHLFEIDFR